MQITDPVVCGVRLGLQEQGARLSNETHVLSERVRTITKYVLIILL